MAKDLQ